MAESIQPPEPHWLDVGAPHRSVKRPSPSRVIGSNVGINRTIIDYSVGSRRTPPPIVPAAGGRIMGSNVHVNETWVRGLGALAQMTTSAYIATLAWQANMMQQAVQLLRPW